MNAMKRETFIHLTSLSVDVDPAMVEQYVQARLQAERAGTTTAATAAHVQVQAQAEIAVNTVRAQAEVTLTSATTKMQGEALAT